MILSCSLINAEETDIIPVKTYHTLNYYNNKINEKFIDLLFAPIGWSKDGKFAYIIEIDPGGADYPETGLFRWVVQDMVTDKCLWKSEKEQEGDYPQNYWEMNKEELFKLMYIKFLTKNQKILDKYGIIKNENLELFKFPLIYNNKEYRGFVMDILRETKYGIPNMITKFKVCLSKEDINKVFGQFNDECLMDVSIAGYIKNPYEARIALIICMIKRGWEGPPHPVEFGLVGCHLEKNY